MCLSCTAHSAVDLNEARALLLIFSEVTVGRIYASPEHCQSTEHDSASNWTTTQLVEVRVYSMMCPLCKGLITSERMGATADVRVRNMCTIK